METDSAALSLAGLMTSMTGLILSFGLATAALAKYNWKKTATAGAILIGGVDFAVATIMGIMLFATKVIYKTRQKGQKSDQIKKDNEAVAETINMFMNSFKPLFKQLKSFMKWMSISMRLIIG